MATAELKTAVDRLRQVELEGLDDRELGQALRDLRACIDSSEVLFSAWAREFQRRGAHLADGSAGVVSWLRWNCNMSGSSAADRVCVGRELESRPEIVDAVASGEIGYQAAAAVCHLFEQLGEKKSDIDEGALLTHAREMSVARLRELCRHLRYAIDPDGCERDAEVDFSRRRLHISALEDGMHVLDAILDPVGGAAVKTALEALAVSGPDDGRRPSQLMADALVELTHHALDSGKLPARRGVRPHISVSTTLEALRGLPGASTIESQPISATTLERMGCDCTISRVLLANSMVIDVGRATRSIPPATRRALQARDQHCRWPGCDRPASWTSPHHIQFWSRGGETRLANLVSLCHFHHREVHEGGWQVVKVGDGLRFIPPQRHVFVPWRERGPGSRQAA